MRFLIALLFLHIQSFILDKKNYNMINETNSHVNKYSVDKKTVNSIKLYKNSFKYDYLPLDLEISSKHLAKIFKLVFDHITSENFSKIDKIFNFEVPVTKNVDQMSFLLNKILNKNYNGCEHFDFIYNKNILLVRYPETLEFVFNYEFTTGLDLNQFSKFSDYISSFPFLNKFNSKIVFVAYKDKSVQMSLPEYFILGLYCFLNGHYDEITNRRNTSKNLCL